MFDAKDIYGNGSYKSMYTIENDPEMKNGKRFVWLWVEKMEKGKLINLLNINSI